MVYAWILLTFCFIILSYSLFYAYDKRYRTGRVVQRNQGRPVNIVYTVPATQLQQSYPAITQTRSTTIYATPHTNVPMQQRLSDAPPTYDQVVLTPSRLQETRQQ